jgi:hypothetical protein
MVPLTARDKTFELSNSLFNRFNIFPFGVISWNKLMGAFINFCINYMFKKIVFKMS